MFKKGDRVIIINGCDSKWNNTSPDIPQGLINQKGLIIEKIEGGYQIQSLVVLITGGKFEGFNFNFDINSKALKPDKIVKKII